MNVARSAHAVTQVKHYFCIAGGFANGQWTNSAEVYDQNKDKWTQLAVMHNPRSSFTLTKANESIYAMGDAAVIERYDPRENCWTVVRALSDRKINWGNSNLRICIPFQVGSFEGGEHITSAGNIGGDLFVITKNGEYGRITVRGRRECSFVRLGKSKNEAMFRGRHVLCQNSIWKKNSEHLVSVLISVLVNPVCIIHKIIPFKIEHNGNFAVKCHFHYSQ